MDLDLPWVRIVVWYGEGEGGGGDASGWKPSQLTANIHHYRWSISADKNGNGVLPLLPADIINRTLMRLILTWSRKSAAEAVGAAATIHTTTTTITNTNGPLSWKMKLGWLKAFWRHLYCHYMINDDRTTMMVMMMMVRPPFLLTSISHHWTHNENDSNTSPPSSLLRCVYSQRYSGGLCRYTT